MYSTPLKSPSKPGKSYLGLKLAALFSSSFLAVFIGLLCLDLLRGFAERALLDAAVSNQPAAIAIDPKLETELAKVLEYTDAQNTADIKNPFADPNGLSGIVSTTMANAPAVQATSPAGRVNPAAAQNNQQKNQAQQNVPGRSFQSTQPVNSNPQAETKARLRLRDERISLGMDGGPESAVFAIDDLLPVGTVSGGDGKEEVMFYSESACRVVSFPVGARFYDGYFDSLRPEGVVFGFFDQYRTRRMRAWGRSVVPGCAQTGLITPLPDQAGITEGGD